MSEPTGLPGDRRAFLRRSAVIGASTVWTVPLVQALGQGQAAAASPGTYRVQFRISGESAATTVVTRVPPTTDVSCQPPGWGTAADDPGAGDLPITATFDASAGGTFTLTDVDGCRIVAGTGKTEKFNLSAQCETGFQGATNKVIIFGSPRGNRYYTTIRLVVTCP